MLIHQNRQSVMKKDLIIIGAGQFGRELYSWTLDGIKAGNDLNVKGFLDDNPDSLKNYKYNIGIISDVGSYIPHENDVFACSISNIKAKMRCCQNILAKGGAFINLFHPTAVVGQNVTMGQGVILGPYVILTCDLTIGNFVTISSHSGVAHDTAIGDWCCINGWCVINGCAVLEEAVFLGSNAVILPGSRVGKHAFVGAGSLVLRRVRDYEKVFGVPAVPIGTTGP